MMVRNLNLTQPQPLTDFASPLMNHLAGAIGGSRRIGIHPSTAPQMNLAAPDFTPEAYCGLVARSTPDGSESSSSSHSSSYVTVQTASELDRPDPASSVTASVAGHNQPVPVQQLPPTRLKDDLALSMLEFISPGDAAQRSREVCFTAENIAHTTTMLRRQWAEHSLLKTASGINWEPDRVETQVADSTGAAVAVEHSQLAHCVADICNRQIVREDLGLFNARLATKQDRAGSGDVIIETVSNVGNIGGYRQPNTPTASIEVKSGNSLYKADGTQFKFREKPLENNGMKTPSADLMAAFGDLDRQAFIKAGGSRAALPIRSYICMYGVATFYTQAYASPTSVSIIRGLVRDIYIHIRNYAKALVLQPEFTDADRWDLAIGELVADCESYTWPETEELPIYDRLTTADQSLVDAKNNLVYRLQDPTSITMEIFNGIYRGCPELAEELAWATLIGSTVGRALGPWYRPAKLDGDSRSMKELEQGLTAFFALSDDPQLGSTSITVNESGIGAVGVGHFARALLTAPQPDPHLKTLAARNAGPSRSEVVTKVRQDDTGGARFSTAVERHVIPCSNPMLPYLVSDAETKIKVQDNPSTLDNYLVQPYGLGLGPCAATHQPSEEFLTRANGTVNPLKRAAVHMINLIKPLAVCNSCPGAGKSEDHDTWTNFLAQTCGYTTEVAAGMKLYKLEKTAERLKCGDVSSYPGRHDDDSGFSSEAQIFTNQTVRYGRLMGANRVKFDKIYTEITVAMHQRPESELRSRRTFWTPDAAIYSHAEKLQMLTSVMAMNRQLAGAVARLGQLSRRGSAAVFIPLQRGFALQFPDIPDACLPSEGREMLLRQRQNRYFLAWQQVDTQDPAYVIPNHERIPGTVALPAGWLCFPGLYLGKHDMAALAAASARNEVLISGMPGTLAARYPLAVAAGCVRKRAAQYFCDAFMYAARGADSWSNLLEMVDEIYPIIGRDPLLAAALFDMVRLARDPRSAEMISCTMFMAKIGATPKEGNELDNMRGTMEAAVEEYLRRTVGRLVDLADGVSHILAPIDTDWLKEQGLKPSDLYDFLELAVTS